MLMLEKVYLKSCICVMKLKFYEEFVKILPEHLSRCLSAQGESGNPTPKVDGNV